ncbi:MAG: hypothetical protein NW218_22135 [Saprospiraceae bacterium]|nr:hypothetical protein [Saprospiraceae bacterium]
MLILCLSSNLIAQQKAGEDKLICLGGSTTIGTNLTICSGCCVKWTPTTGLSDPKSPTPTVQNLSASTEYSLAIVNADGDIVENDKVIVYVCKLDLNLYKPKFVDGIEYQVPKGQEESLGAQTFVNLDSDDNDNTFDNTDNTVNGGDDEFIRIEFLFDIVDLGTLPPPTKPVEIIVSNVPGTDDAAIKLWKSEDKGEGSFTLGEKLTLSKTTPAGTNYKKSLWIEGKLGHTSQRQSKIYAMFEDGTGSSTTCESNKASITILGVKEIKWVGQTNGYTGGDGLNNSDILDLHPSENGYPDHVRVFAESKFFYGAPDPVIRNSVQLKVSLSVKPIEEIPLYLSLFDADDPSDDSNIDPNDDATTLTGIYPGGLNNNWDVMNDNRVEPRIKKAGILKSESGETLTAIVATKLIYKFVFSEAFIQPLFYTSSFPGDNYQVGLYCDLDFVNNFRNKDKVDKKHIVFVSSTCNNNCNPIDNSLKSQVLTVWRTLHVEYDKMKNPDWTDNLMINGTFSDFSGIGSKLSKTKRVSGIVSTSTGVLNPNEPLKDNSTTTYTYPGPGGATLTDLGRFVNGGIRIGSGLLPLCTPTASCIGKHGSNWLEANSGIFDLTFGGNLPCTLKDPVTGGAGNQNFIISEIEKLSGSRFYVTLKNPTGINLMPFNGKQLSIAGGEFCANCVEVSSVSDKLHFTISSTAGASNLKIPIEIIDDDAIPLGGTSNLIQPVGFTKAKTAFEEAYIDVCVDGGGKIENNEAAVPFIRNINTTIMPDPYSNPKKLDDFDELFCASNFYERPSYWCTYVVSGWQSGTDSDVDPITESSYAALTYGDILVRDCEVSIGKRGTFLFLESMRDLTRDIEVATAHELGHQFGLSHGLDDVLGTCSPCMSAECPASMGLMNVNGIAAPSERFIAKHLNFIRCRSISPGQVK